MLPQTQGECEPKRTVPFGSSCGARGKVLVAMSGGVDSSATALLLQQAGYDCVGATMRLYDPARFDCKKPAHCSIDNALDARDVQCIDDAQDAQRIAETLGMPFHVLDCRGAFERQVIERFVDGYARGCTPNPCILCNRHLKFGFLFDKAKALGCDFVATGHYARVEQDAAGLFHLKCGVDPKKDQSYVLYMLGQRQLARLLLPLGEFEKAQVRDIAEARGLVSARKRESQDICFVPDGDYAGFLAREGVRDEPGNFLDQQGRIVGRHRGIVHYTIGQRKGLGLAMGEPVYVTRIDAIANTVTVGPRDALSVESFRVDDVTSTSGRVPEGELQAEVRTHYHALRVPARIVITGTCAHVRPLAPLGAVAPGQAAVFYQDDEVIGGGTIAR